VRALGGRRIAIVSPYSDAVNEWGRALFRDETWSGDGHARRISRERAYAIGQLGPQHAREAFGRIDPSAIDVFVVPGGNFPTMSSIVAWEQEFGRPVVTTNQASVWAMLREFKSADRLPAFGRLLAELPADR
jgi:maleate isomerase